MSEQAINAVTTAIGRVMEISTEGITTSTTFTSIKADSVALILIADVIEEMFPQYLVTNDVLKSVRTVGELATGLVARP